MIISSIKNPIPVVSLFTCDIMVMNTVENITIGQVLIVHAKADKANGKIIKIHQISIGDKIKKSMIVPKNHFALVDIQLDKPLCMEIKENYDEFSRITLRNEGKTVACGVVKKILK